jgi:hypothetical protein
MLLQEARPFEDRPQVLGEGTGHREQISLKRSDGRHTFEHLCGTQLARPPRPSLDSRPLGCDDRAVHIADDVLAEQGQGEKG